MRNLRAFLVVATLYVWFAVATHGGGPNTTWEHHPYAGPFIMLKTSQSLADFVLCALVLLAIGVPAIRWVRSGSIGALILSVIAAGSVTWLSWLFAKWASC